jgi:hypothetical protein
MPNAVGSNDHTALVGLIIAIYGAVVATVNSTIQVINHRKDRADVILKVRPNMTALNNRRYAGMKLTVVTATNRGKRPVTIQGFAAKLLDTYEQYWMSDTQPALPHEITEGKEVAVFVDEAQEGREFIECYYVWDSVGRNFTINMVSWHRRVWSHILRKIAPVKRLKK